MIISSIGLDVVLFFIGLWGVLFFLLLWRSRLVHRLLAGWGILTYITMIGVPIANLFIPRLSKSNYDIFRHHIGGIVHGRIGVQPCYPAGTRQPGALRWRKFAYWFQALFSRRSKFIIRWRKNKFGGKSHFSEFSLVFCISLFYSGSSVFTECNGSVHSVS